MGDQCRDHPPLDCVGQPGTPATWLTGMSSEPMIPACDDDDEIPATQTSAHGEVGIQS